MSRDLSHVKVLPKGTPLLIMRGPGAAHKFVVLGEKNRYFVGLVIKSWLVQPLAYTETFDEGLAALKMIISGFAQLGFVLEHGEIKNGEKE